MGAEIPMLSKMRCWGADDSTPVFQSELMFASDGSLNRSMQHTNDYLGSRSVALTD